jgi:hypothetical protein
LGFVIKQKSLYTSAKTSVLGAAWSLLPSLELMSWMLLGTFLVTGADDLDAAWSLPPCYLLFPFID